MLRAAHAKLIRKMKKHGGVESGTFDAKYDIAFTNPEAFISCKEGMNLLISKANCIRAQFE